MTTRDGRCGWPLLLVMLAGVAGCAASGRGKGPAGAEVAPPPSASPAVATQGGAASRSTLGAPLSSAPGPVPARTFAEAVQRVAAIVDSDDISESECAAAVQDAERLSAGGSAQDNQFVGVAAERCDLRRLAAPFYRRAIAAAPRYVEALTALAALLLDSDPREADKLLTAALAVNPYDGDAHYLRGVAAYLLLEGDSTPAPGKLEATGLWQTARSELGLVLATPSPPGLLPDVRAHVVLGLAGLAARRAGVDVPLGLIELGLSEALRLRSDDAAVLNALGLVAEARGDHAQAEVRWRRAAELSKSWDAPALNLARLELRLRRFSEAAALVRPSDQAPRNAYVSYMILGLTYAARGSLDKAADSYGKAIRMKPTWGPAHFDLGVLEQGRGNCDAAASAFESFVKTGQGSASELADARARIAACGKAGAR